MCVEKSSEKKKEGTIVSSNLRIKIKKKIYCEYVFNVICSDKKYQSCQRLYVLEKFEC